MGNLPIQTLHLFDKLDALLIEVLKSLSADDWGRYTLARQWTIKDVAAHLLDGNLRSLSISRDGYFGNLPPVSQAYADVVHYLNDINNIWVLAYKRISPPILIDMLEQSGREYTEYLKTLEPDAAAVFPVSWAGHTESPNWFHIAREYTEKWHHQQQIREAVGLQQTLMEPELFMPVIDTFMRALPHRYQQLDAPIGTLIRFEVSGESGGMWFLEKTFANWRFVKNMAGAPAVASVTLPPDLAWKIFTKAVKAADAQSHILVQGEADFVQPFLNMVTVMA